MNIVGFIRFTLVVKIAASTKTVRKVIFHEE